MSPICLAPRTNCAHTEQVFRCAQLVQIPILNRAHPILRVRAVHPPHGVKSVELTNRAHPPVPPRGVCGQLAGTPEPTARTVAVRVQCARFEEVGSEAIRYSRAGVFRRRPREQPQRESDFLPVVRTPGRRPWAPTLGRVAAGPRTPVPTTWRPLGHTGQRRPPWAKTGPKSRPGGPERPPWAPNRRPRARSGPRVHLHGGSLP
jgi:hypothetical protein